MKRLLALLWVLVTVAATAGPVTVRDGLGRRLVVPRPPQRMVSLTPSVTEILYALKLQDRVVGVTSNDRYPPEVRQKPSVGDMRPDFEKLLALHPDLVVLEGRMSPTTLEGLDHLHLPTLALDSATLEGYRRSVILLGQVTGATARAAALLSAMDARMAAIDRLVKAQPTHPSVFIEVWDRPLQTATAGTFMDELLQRAGGRNCFADLQGYPQISAEQLVVRKPDVVILTTSTVEQFKQRPGMAGLPAVQQGRVYQIQPPDIVVRTGPRLADGLEMLYRILYNQ